MTIVVLPDGGVRELLCRALRSRGIDAVGVADWFAAAEVARAQPVISVVFGPLPLNGLGWHEHAPGGRAIDSAPVLVSIRQWRGERRQGSLPTHPPTHPPQNPAARPTDGAPMAGNPHPDPIVVDASHGDMNIVAAEVARIVLGVTRRREFTVRFNEYCARYAAGDQATVAELFRMTRQALAPVLHRWILAKGHHEPSEVVQDAIADSVVEALARGTRGPRRIEAPLAWLLRVARNRLLNRWRHARTGSRLYAVGLDAELDRQAARSEAGVLAFQDPVERRDEKRLFCQRVRKKCWNPGEERLVHLRYIVQASVADQAASIGGGHLPHLEQVALVERWIKRIAGRPERKPRPKRRQAGP